MKLKLHEVECGTADVASETAFFQSLFNSNPVVQQPALTVFKPGSQMVDFNLSTHLPPGVVSISFLTDDLPAVEKFLQASNTRYQGPQPSHLGMTCLRFQTPDGLRIVVNTPGSHSPAWLWVQ